MNKRILLLVASIISIGFSQTSFAKLNIESINQKLQAQGAQWTAKQSWVTELDTASAKRLMGVRGHHEADVDFKTFDTFHSLSNDAWDWRNVNGQSWVGPVMDQGNCGSCVAFASIGTLEAQMNIATKIPWLNQQFSPQALFACGGGGCETGWWPSSAANFLQRTGVPDEACSPYVSGATGQDVACNSICSDASSRSQKINNVTTPSGGSVDYQAVKQALQQGPLVTTLTVYADFMSYGSGVYKHTTGEYLGGHAVSLIGYDDAKRAWIIRNSWGPTWGDNGFAYVSYDDESGVASETWGYQINPTDGQVALANVRDRDFVNGQFAFQVKSSFANTDSLRLKISQSNGLHFQEISCQAPNCDLAVDTANMPDGQYDVQAVAQLKDGTVKMGEKKYIFIANHDNQLAISIQPKGFDITQPLKGRVEFEVSTQSGVLPMSSVHFIAKDTTGKVIVDRAAPIVMQGLVMGWRTNVIPQGKYEIYFVGHQITGGVDHTVETQHYQVTAQN